jgi:CRP-like cAMP-binding protein
MISLYGHVRAAMSHALSLLENLHVFRGLTKREIGTIEKIAVQVSYKAGETVFEECSKGNDLYVIMSGKVKIQLESIVPHHDISLSTLKTGQIFGELALIDAEPRSANVLCLEDTKILVINGEKLQTLFEKNHRMGYVVMSNIAKTICDRIRKTNKQLFKSLRTKLFAP